MKADLQKIIIDCIANPGSPAKVETEKKVFVIDMIAHVHIMTEIPTTFMDLAQKFVKSIPSGYTRIDIVADTYRENSIKSAERNARGISSKVIGVKSLQSKVSDFLSFLKNRTKPARMIDLIFEFIVENRVIVCSC